MLHAFVWCLTLCVLSLLCDNIYVLNNFFCNFVYLYSLVEDPKKGRFRAPELKDWLVLEVSLFELLFV